MVCVDRVYRVRKQLSPSIVKHKGSYKDKNVKVKCSCGCNGKSSGMIGDAIADVFLRKKYWFAELNISPKDVPNQFIIQYDKLSEATINLLDISSLPADLARQKWVRGAYLTVVRDSIATFCYLNNIGYWQGVHSIACALIFLKPTPTLQELSILLEKILLRFAPIIAHNKSSITIQCAKQLSSLWNSLFQLFLPMTSAVLNDFCATWNIDIFWTLGFHRFNCAYNCLYHWYFIIKCGNVLFTPTLDQIIAPQSNEFTNLTQHNETGDNESIGHILSFLYFELAQNLLRHNYWQKTCGLQSLINNFSFDKQYYSIQDMMDLLSLCIQQEFSQNNQLLYPPDVFINMSDYHFDNICLEGTNLSNYPMSLLVILVKSLYLLTPKFIIKCINNFVNDLCTLNVHKRGHVDNNFRIETSRTTKSLVDYDYMKYIKHFQVAKIELTQIISYIQPTSAAFIDKSAISKTVRFDNSKVLNNARLKNGTKSSINKMLSDLVCRAQDKIGSNDPSNMVYKVMKNYYSIADKICYLKSDTVVCPELPANDIPFHNNEVGADVPQVPLSARGGSEGDNNNRHIPVLRKTMSTNEIMYSKSLSPSTPRTGVPLFRPRVKPKSEVESVKLESCNWPFFYSTVFGKFLFIDLTNEFLLPKEFNGGKTIYYSNESFHFYNKQSNKLEHITDFKEIVSEIVPIRSPFGYTLNSTCWIIVTKCNPDCNDTDHSCYDGKLDTVTTFIQRELMFSGASFILHYQGDYFALSEYINTLAETHILSGMMSRFGLRHGALWFNSQPIFSADSCRLRPIDCTFYSSRLSNSPAKDRLVFKFSCISHTAVAIMKRLLKKYQYISMNRRVILVKVQGELTRNIEIIFCKILPKIGLYLSHIEENECQITQLNIYNFFPKFMKLTEFRLKKMKLFQQHFRSAVKLLVETLSNSTFYHPLVDRIKISSPTGTFPLYIDILDKKGLVVDSMNRHCYFTRFLLMEVRKESDKIRENVIYNTGNISRVSHNPIVKRTATISHTTMRALRMENRRSLDKFDFVKNATLRDVQNVKNVALRRCNTLLISHISIHDNNIN